MGLFLFTRRKLTASSCKPSRCRESEDGVKFRFIFREALLPHNKPALNELPAVEKRMLTVISGLIFCTEKEAALLLQTIDCRIGYIGFFGKNPDFVN
jgi:hypothetical protein